MTITKELTAVTIPVTIYDLQDITTERFVAFTIYRENGWFKAVPVLSTVERLSVGLPEELVFRYSNYCIVDANDWEDETLSVMKQIILELEVQEFI
ncbi:MAG TPA: hypothetical protein VGN63_12230 [Flavisolibacter sp.]|jgi:hypothetical protein|nr:hypothetical protein [Flavisolibacter sp.]